MLTLRFTQEIAHMIIQLFGVLAFMFRSAVALAFPSQHFLADVTLPSLLADHMVVQRGLPVHLWGMAAPAESVR